MDFFRILRFQICTCDANSTIVPSNYVHWKDKKKEKNNSFVVINQINYPSFNEDWCTNATFFFFLSLPLPSSRALPSNSSIHLSGHSSLMYLNHGTSKEESRKMGQRNFHSYSSSPFFRFDDPIREKWSSR